MKRLLAALLSLICLISLCGCASGRQAVDTENISRILCCGIPGNADGIEVPSEDMAEMIDWLDGFTVGRRVGSSPLAPGSNSYWVIIEYGDGHSVSVGLDAVEIDGSLYYVERESVPECFFEAFGDEE